MASIINGLFAGRAGISSHGVAIAVVGDNISNASTIGYKASRAEFEDFVAGGQSSGRVVGAGSNVSSITSINTQGTLEFTGRSLDVAVDGNGFFVVADGAQRFFTRAGNFKVDSAGFIVDQNSFAVLGFPNNGSGSLEPINVNTVTQDSVATRSISIAGNLDASAAEVNLAAFDASNPVTAPGVTPPSTTTYSSLSAAAEFSVPVDVFDSLGSKHTVTFFYFKSGSNEYTARAYVNSEKVDGGSTPPTGIPRFLGERELTFNSNGTRSNAPIAGVADFTLSIPWNNGSTASSVAVSLASFSQFSANSGALSITQDGKGVGAVSNISIEPDGRIFALLDNGQRANIATMGLVNFSNAEGLQRIGKNLLQQSSSSGEPIVGTPDSGQFGGISSGSLELSTVDIASEFVKLITLQRGFQANSRIITTINSLLNEIIQLA